MDVTFQIFETFTEVIGLAVFPHGLSITRILPAPLFSNMERLEVQFSIGTLWESTGYLIILTNL